MLVERTVFQAKYGRGDELVALFQELNGRIRDEAGGEQASRFRILTDASGRFFTVGTTDPFAVGLEEARRHLEVDGWTQDAIASARYSKPDPTQPARAELHGWETDGGMCG